MLSIIVSLSPGGSKPRGFTYFYFFFSGCYHDNSWKVQPIQTKFSHMTFDWNSLAKFENGHHRSHVTLLNRGLLPPSKLTYLRFQPIQTRFSHMTFDCNSSSEFENGHHRSNVTPIIGGFCPPKIQIPPILMTFKPYVLATK